MPLEWNVEEQKQMETNKNIKAADAQLKIEANSDRRRRATPEDETAWPTVDLERSHIDN